MQALIQVKSFFVKILAKIKAFFAPENIQKVDAEISQLGAFVRMAYPVIKMVLEMQKQSQLSSEILAVLQKLTMSPDAFLNPPNSTEKYAVIFRIATELLNGQIVQAVEDAGNAGVQFGTQVVTSANLDKIVTPQMIAGLVAFVLHSFGVTA